MNNFRENLNGGELFLEGKSYLSLKKASELSGYHSDYLGRLARRGKIFSRRLGSQWFIERAALNSLPRLQAFLPDGAPIYKDKVEEVEVPTFALPPETDSWDKELLGAKARLDSARQTRPRPEEIFPEFSPTKASLPAAKFSLTSFFSGLLAKNFLVPALAAFLLILAGSFYQKIPLPSPFDSISKDTASFYKTAFDETSDSLSPRILALKRAGEASLFSPLSSFFSQAKNKVSSFFSFMEDSFLALVGFEKEFEEEKLVLETPPPTGGITSDVLTSSTSDVEEPVVPGGVFPRDVGEELASLKAELKALKAAGLLVQTQPVDFASLDQRLKAANDAVLAQVKSSLSSIEQRIQPPSPNPVMFFTVPNKTPEKQFSGISSGFGSFDAGLDVGGNFSAYGKVTLGRDDKNVSITSSVWNITSAGAASGFTSLSANSTSAGTLTAGNATFSGNLTFSNNSTTTIPSSLINAFSFATSTSAAPFLSFDTLNYRIGIGTTTPGRTFSVAGDILASGALNVSGSATSSFSGPLTVAGIFTANSSSLTISSTSTVTTQFTVTRIPVTAHTFASWAIGASGSAVTDASLLVNSASAASDTNLFGLAVADGVRFLVDAEGDVFANSVTLTGGSSLATTSINTLTIENNATFGDAIGDSVTFKAGTLAFHNFATTTIASSTASGSGINAFSFATSTSVVPMLSFDTTNSRLGILTVAPTNRFDVGSGQFVITSSGQVGIGTTSPVGLLSVEMGANAFPFWVGDEGTSTPAFVVRGSGNVGIGTTNPGAKLEVAGQIKISGTGNNILLNGHWLSNDGEDEGVFVSTAGNVGIGTAGPTESLHIVAINPRITLETNTNTGNNEIKFVDETGAQRFALGYRDSTQNFVIGTTNVATNERLLIDGNGNVGIGTTSPGSLLSVHGNGLFSNNLSVAGLTATGTIALNAFPYASLAASTEKNDVNFNLARTVQFASGDLATQRAVLVQAPTYSFTASSTLTDASTFLLTGAPKSGTFATSTNLYALKIDAGSVLSSGGIAPTNAYGLYVSAPTGATNNYGAVFASGNVGIGTTSPYGLLSVEQGTEAASFWVGNTGSSTPSFMVNGVNGNGRVGIGTASPTSGELLSVVGAGNVGLHRYSADALYNTVRILKARGTEASPAVPNSGDVLGRIEFGGYNGTTDVVGAYIVATTNNDWSGTQNGTNLAMYGTSVNATTPQLAWEYNGSQDHVFYSSGVQSFKIFANGDLTIKANVSMDSTAKVGYNTTSAYYYPYEGILLNTSQGGLHFQTTAGTDAMSIVLTTGNVGIATTSPYSRLSVAGQIVGQNYMATSTTATSTFSGGLTVGNNAALVVNQAATANSLYITGSGDVGIGNTNPKASLHIGVTDNSALMGAFNIIKNGQNLINFMAFGTNRYPELAFTAGRSTLASPTATLSGDELGRISFSGQLSTTIGDNGPAAQISALATANWVSGSQRATDLVFYTATGNNNPTEQMRITGGGNVGIGTTSPASLLSVHGNGLFSNNISVAGLTATGTIALNAFPYTSLTASTEKNDVNFNLARTVQFASGDLTTQRAVLVQAPTYSFTASSTLTDASTFLLTGAPKSGTFATSTNLYALKIDAGSVLSSGGIAPTNAYGLYVSAPTGATNNYGAVFASGNVGIGTTSPAGKLEIGSGQILGPDGSTPNPTYSFSNNAGLGIYGYVPTQSIIGIVADTIRFITNTNDYNAPVVLNLGISSAADAVEFAPQNNLDRTSGTQIAYNFRYNFAPGSGTPTDIFMRLASTINWGGTPGAGSYEALRIAVTETSLPTGTNYLIRAMAGSAGTTDRFVVTNAGNVGIGTTSPGSLLSVQGNALISGNLSVAGITATSTLNLTGLLTFGNASGTQLTTTGSTYLATTGGNVGIGMVDTSGYPLTIQTSATTQIGLKTTVTGTSANAGIYFDTGDGPDWVIGRGVSGINTNFIIREAGVADHLVVVATTGNVGIGTTSPGSLLAVHGNGLFSNNLSVAGLTATGTVAFTGTTATTTISGGLSVGNNAALVVNQAATANSLYITGSGNVGIGTANPEVALSVVGAGRFTTDLDLYGGDIRLGTGAATTTFTVPADGAITFTPGTTGNDIVMNTNNSFYFNVDANNDATNERFVIGANRAGVTGGTEIMWILETGNVGIGTTSPWGLLSVEQGSTGPVFVVSDQGTSTPSLIVAGNGNVGIGTAGPTASLHVASSGAGDDIIFETITNNDLGLTFNRNAVQIAVFNFLSTGPSLSSRSGLDFTIAPSNNLVVNTGGINQVARFLSTDDLAQLSIEDDDTIAYIGAKDSRAFLGLTSGLSANNLVIDNSGNVGIGTTSPVRQLHLQSATSPNRIRLDNTAATPNQGIEMYESGVVKGIMQRENGDKLAFYAGDATTQDMVILDSGNVGIGTTSPDQLLSIFSATTPSIEFSSASGPTNKWTMGIDTADAHKFKIASSTAVGTNARLTIDGAGRVGIGTAAPRNLLDVTSGAVNTLGDTPSLVTITGPGTSDETGRTLGIQSNSEMGANIGPRLDFFARTTTANTAAGIYASIAGHKENATSANLDGYLAFFTRLNAGGNDERMRITSTGNVGIGTTSPNTLLAVVGTTTIGSLSTATQAGINIGFGGLCVDNDGTCVASTTGRISSVTSTTGNTDVAEIYLSDENLEKGEIVAATEGTKVKKAGLGNLSGVVGVVSTDPGVILGLGPDQNAEAGYPIALAGRVPVKVNLEGGEIKIGDRITSSSMAGVGMKATTSGIAVGIALEPFDGSQNFGTSTPKILVFVNLGYSKLDFAEGNPSIDSGWIVEQSSGKIKTSYILDMDGKDIVNVRKILSASGLWSIDENGKLIVQEIQTAKLTVTGPQGITILDRATNQPVCVFSENGVLKSEAGECGAQNPPPLPPPYQGGDQGEVVADTEPPTITILGNNPAIINVGASYADMGVTVTDNVDSNLGYTASVDGGTALSQGDGLLIDTSTTTTHAILYTATDQAGNTATASRTVNVVDPNATATASADTTTTP